MRIAIMSEGPDCGEPLSDGLLSNTPEERVINELRADASTLRNRAERREQDAKEARAFADAKDAAANMLAAALPAVTNPEALVAGEMPSDVVDFRAGAANGTEPVCARFEDHPL